MTRPSRRELECRAEELLDRTNAVADDRRLVVWENAKTGEWFDDPEHGDPIEKVDADPKIVFREETVKTPWTPESVGGVEA